MKDVFWLILLHVIGFVGFVLAITMAYEAHRRDQFMTVVALLAVALILHVASGELFHRMRQNVRLVLRSKKREKGVLYLQETPIEKEGRVLAFRQNDTMSDGSGDDAA